jgi:CotS family spore coat protein
VQGEESREMQGLVSKILSAYPAQLGLKEKTAEKEDDHWLLKGARQSFALWEYQEESRKLALALEWQEHLSKHGCPGVLSVQKTKDGKVFLPQGEGYYYLTPWVEGTPVEMSNKATLLAVTELLAAIHENPVNNESPPKVAPPLSWLKVRQDRLAELWQVYYLFQESGAGNDFARLYLENFPDVYQRGQEALEKMVLAGVELSPNSSEGLLVGNIEAENFRESKEGVFLLRTTHWRTGPVLGDLALFLKMYLPLYRWDDQVARDVITHYQERLPLSTGEKYFLLAFLAFPNRFLLYTQQYFCTEQNGAANMAGLTEKLQNFLYELAWQEQCLASLEQWLWGEKRGE